MAPVTVHKPTPTGPLPDDQKLFDREQVARLLAVSPDSVRRLPVPGKVKLNRLVRYVRADVEAWIAAGCPAPAPGG